MKVWGYYKISEYPSFGMGIVKTFGNIQPYRVEFWDGWNYALFCLQLKLLSWFDTQKVPLPRPLVSHGFTGDWSLLRRPRLCSQRREATLFSRDIFFVTPHLQFATAFDLSAMCLNGFSMRNLMQWICLLHWAYWVYRIGWPTLSEAGDGGNKYTPE